MHRSAALFNYETELCDALASHLMRFGVGMRVRRQLQIGAEIPDFVLTLAPSRVAPRVNAIESAILAQLLDGRCLATDCVADLLYTQCERVVAGLARLRRLGLVAESAPDLWTLSPDIERELGVSRVIAIEAKLTRWQDALAQAVSYLRFANLSFVALPLNVVRRRSEELRADCREHGVGLLGVATNELLIDVTPPIRDVRSADWVWTLMRMMVNDRPRTRGTRSASCADGSSLFAG